MKKTTRGFTLIELMIVVAIVGVLSSIAIPSFIKYQLRSKRSEGALNIAAIRTAEISYAGTHDTYVNVSAEPRSSPNAQKAKWCAVGSCDYFDTLAWRPEGSVYFVYGVNGANGNLFTATAIGDVDGDSLYSCWAFLLSKPVGNCIQPTNSAACGAAVACDQVVMNAGYSAHPDDIY